MGTVAVACLSITVTCSAMAGAFIWPILSRRFELKSSRTILACIVVMEVIPLYGLLGFVPFIQSWGVGGSNRPGKYTLSGLFTGRLNNGLCILFKHLEAAYIPHISPYQDDCNDHAQRRWQIGVGLSSLGNLHRPHQLSLNLDVPTTHQRQRNDFAASSSTT